MIPSFHPFHPFLKSGRSPALSVRGVRRRIIGPHPPGLPERSILALRDVVLFCPRGCAGVGAARVAPVVVETAENSGRWASGAAGYRARRKVLARRAPAR